MTTRDDAIIEFADWLLSPPGRYLLDWEQARIDHAVADLFGFHALQLGLPQLDALRANRMPHRWVAQDSLVVPERVGAAGTAGAHHHAVTQRAGGVALRFRCAAVSEPERRPAGVASWTGVGARPARNAARGRACAGARGACRDRRLQSGESVGAAPALGLDAPAPGLFAAAALPAARRRVHGLLAAARLVAPAQLRGRTGPLRLLACAGAHRRRGSTAGPGSKVSASAGGRCSGRCTS